MITVGRILAAIRRDKQYQQGALHTHLKEYISLGQLRLIESGHTHYIDPVVLHKWLEWLELPPEQCEYLIQDNIRCLVRHQLSDVKLLKVKPQLLAAIADLVSLITRGKPIEIDRVVGQLTTHNLPHLLTRPAYIDTMINRVQYE